MAGGDPVVGRKLGPFLAEAGFVGVRMGTEYECYPDCEVIAEYLALRLDATEPTAAMSLREWSLRPGELFAQAWVSAVGRTPTVGSSTNGNVV